MLLKLKEKNSLQHPDFPSGHPPYSKNLFIVEQVYDPKIKVKSKQVYDPTIKAKSKQVYDPKNIPCYTEFVLPPRRLPVSKNTYIFVNQYELGQSQII